MARKSSKSTALVPAGGRKSVGARRSKAPTPVPATLDTLTPVLGYEVVVTKLAGSGGEIICDDGVVLVTGRAYATGEGVLPAEEIYYQRGTRPLFSGQSLGEADKVAWRDQTSGYDCIIMRDPRGGFLSGYVGIPRGHPLWGWAHRAIPPDLGIEVHGGLTYSAPCQDVPSQMRHVALDAQRICHVRAVPPTYASDYQPEDAHAWWFGFSCNHSYDVISADGPHSRRLLASENGQQYRDDAYVAREITNLAAQLRAIADGVPVPPRKGPPLPPIGLDPHRGG